MPSCSPRRAWTAGLSAISPKCCRPMSAARRGARTIGIEARTNDTENPWNSFCIERWGNAQRSGTNVPSWLAWKAAARFPSGRVGRVDERKTSVEVAVFLPMVHNA